MPFTYPQFPEDDQVRFIGLYRIEARTILDQYANVADRDRVDTIVPTRFNETRR